MTVAVKGGRPPAFSSVEELEGKLAEYQAIIKAGEADKLTPTTVGFANFVGINRKVLTVEWLNDPEKSEYHDSIKKIVQYCESTLIEKALANKANPIFSMFLLKCNHNYVDKQVIEANVSVGFELRGAHGNLESLETSHSEAIDVTTSPEKEGK